MRNYTSASEINCFMDSPAAWLLSYGYGYRSRGSDAMQRGLDVEDAIMGALRHGNDPKTDHLDDVGKHMVESGFPVMKELAEIYPPVWPKEGTQWKISWATSHLSIIGYLDYFGRDVIIDLKTTANCPSSFPSASARQAVIYQKAMCQTIDAMAAMVTGTALESVMENVLYPEVVYVYLLKRKKDPVKVFSTNLELELDTCNLISPMYLDDAIQEVEQAYQTIFKLQTMSLDELRSILPLNTDHYRFGGYDQEIMTKFRMGTLEPTDPLTPFVKEAAVEAVLAPKPASFVTTM